MLPPDIEFDPDDNYADGHAGTEFGEFRRLLVDLHFKALPAQRNRRREAAEPRSNYGNATRASHQAMRGAFALPFLNF